MTQRANPTREAPAPSAPTANPFRLDLGGQRARAEALHRALLAGEAEALARLRACRPGTADPAAPVDMDAAREIIARELGLPDWPGLEAHVQSLDRARRAIADGGPAPDAAVSTLHVRCGGDLRQPLAAAGFRGEYLEYADPLCQGPLVARPDWIATRAAFLHRAYGARLSLDPQRTAAMLSRLESALDTARERHARVVLWFEHDSYDQLILARCLARLGERPPSRLELVTANRYPGTARFLGLGQLPPEALFLLWESRRPVSEAQLRAGRRVWDLLCAPDPTALALAAAEGIPDLPDMARALGRHCRELPWRGDGLGLTERLALEGLARGPRPIGALFREAALERDPLPWLGDAMFLHIVESLGRAGRPVYTPAPEAWAGEWPEVRLTLSDVGRRVLAGEVDWLSLEPPPRFVGGVPIRATGPGWRWDEARALPVLS